MTAANTSETTWRKFFAIMGSCAVVALVLVAFFALCVKLFLIIIR